MADQVKPGEATTEYAEVQKSNWMSKVLIVLGIIGTVIGSTLTALQQFTEQTGSTNPTLALSVTIGSIVLATLGGIREALTTGAYVNSRTIVKAAASQEKKAA